LEHLGDPQAVLVIEASGFFKKNRRSADAACRYSGMAGRIENCPIRVLACKMIQEALVMRKLLLALLTIALLCATAAATEFRGRPEWGHYFEEASTRGTFVLYDLQRDSYQVSDRQRAETRFIPASTYKIPHTLIALETGVAADEHQVFPWDGTQREYATWNRDHTLRTALKYSVVPVYQGIARQIGERRMQEYVTKFDYGNADISGGIDRFWLDGGLRISPIEQLQFLVKLYRNALPVQERSQRIVKEIMLTEATSEYILRAKTGYGTRFSPGIGWWVGWVERDDNTYFFAINMDITGEAQLGARIAIAKAIMRSERILPEP
jgi:beta-lactamase class D